MIIHNSINLNN